MNSSVNGSSASSSSQPSDSKPLLVRMATDPQFLEPLLAFARRRAYANYRGDFMVTLRYRMKCCRSVLIQRLLAYACLTQTCMVVVLVSAGPRQSSQMTSKR
jgi:hypothetical protein